MLENFDLQLLNVGYEPVGEDWNWKDVCSPFARIYLVESGSAHIRFDNELLELKEGFLYLIPPFQKHTCIGNKGFVHYYLHLYENPERGLNIFNEFKFNTEVPARKSDITLFQMFVNIFPENRLDESDPEVYDNDSYLRDLRVSFTQRPPCEKMLAKGAMLILISRFIDLNASANKFRDPRIVHVCNYINSHIGDEISLDKLSELACMSKSHFIRIFKQEMGQTPAQYIIRCRIERAQLFLLLDNKPIKSIADLLGFSDLPYFIKIFKKHTGQTPLEFRTSRLSERYL